MLKVSHTTMIVLSGLVWLGVGGWLLFLGLNFIFHSISPENLVTVKRPFLDSIAPYVGGLEQAAIVLIALAMFAGRMKGRYVFGKTVQKGVDRILTLPNPSSLAKIYTAKYYILLGSMVLLGVLMRFASLDIRGGVDVTIGLALLYGAILYFRKAFETYQRSKKVSVSSKV